MTVTAVTIDDASVTDRINPDQRLIELHGIDREDWEVAQLTIEVTAPAAEIHDAKDPVCVAVVNCGSSNTRVSTVLETDTNTVGRWSGEVTLDRAFWFSDAEIRCGIVATVDGESDRIVGWADPWNARLDDLPNRPVNGAINITWIDFSNPGQDKIYLSKFQEHYTYLSIDPDEPQLFLNRGFDGLEQLLVDRRRRSADRALHDQTRASIANTTWTALFNSAMNAVDVDDATGEPIFPAIDWQRSLLETLFSRMYTDKAPQEALAEAWAARSAADNPGVLQELLMPASAAQVQAPRMLREGIRSVTRENEKDEQGTTDE